MRQPSRLVYLIAHKGLADVYDGTFDKIRAVFLQENTPIILDATCYLNPQSFRAHIYSTSDEGTGLFSAEELIDASYKMKPEHKSESTIDQSGKVQYCKSLTPDVTNYITSLTLDCNAHRWSEGPTDFPERKQMESRTVKLNDTVVPADPHDDTVYTVVAVEPGNHQDRLVTLSYGDGQIGYAYIWSIRYYGHWYIDDPLMDEEDIATRYEEVTERD